MRFTNAEIAQQELKEAMAAHKQAMREIVEAHEIAMQMQNDLLSILETLNSAIEKLNNKLNK